MYQVIYDFISNSLIGATTLNTYGISEILSIISVVLIYIFLIKVLIWFFKETISMFQFYK